MRLLSIFLLVIGIVAATLASVALARPNGKPGGGGGSGSSNFEITGSVGPVYPMTDAALTLKVENPATFEILVTELTIDVADASEDCAAGNLLVERVTVPFSVPARGETMASTTVSLVHDVADACQGQTFPLTYRGTATKP